MSVVEIAIAKLKTLPEDKQAFVAEVIEHITTFNNGVFRIRDGVMQGAAQADNHELSVDDETAALWKHCDL